MCLYVAAVSVCVYVHLCAWMCMCLLRYVCIHTCLHAVCRCPCMHVIVCTSAYAHTIISLDVIMINYQFYAKDKLSNLHYKLQE